MAQQEDLEELVELLQILFCIEEDFSFDAGKQRQGLSLMLNNERGCILVVEVENRVVGMCTGQLVVSTAQGGPSVLVEDMVIQPAHRGKGFGRFLLDAMTSWAKEQGASRMQLLADRNNEPGLAYYAHLGWQTTALICLRRLL
jgi:GNAT superfamily N-acetyltransferase